MWLRIQGLPILQVRRAVACGIGLAGQAKAGGRVFVSPVSVKESGHETSVPGAQPAAAVLGAGLGEPGADLDGVTAHGDLLTGAGGPALTVLFVGTLTV
ncbi:hypothetical protein BGK72_00330 [Streptomyces agglomeratus]|nr:hypothetical protein BGK72_00330 [Streptomyces agglomeratus]